MLQNVVRNAPRHLRSHVHNLIGKTTPLWLLSPAECGDTLWRYAVQYLGNMVLIGKGVRTCKLAESTARNRFGKAARRLATKKNAKAVKVAA